MRDNKPFTIIALPKNEKPVQHYHCAVHSSRMIRLPDGLRCPICGGVDIATYQVQTERK